MKLKRRHFVQILFISFLFSYRIFTISNYTWEAVIVSLVMPSQNIIYEYMNDENRNDGIYIIFKVVKLHEFQAKKENDSSPKQWVLNSSLFTPALR